MKMTAYKEKNVIKGGQYTKYNNIEKSRLIFFKQIILNELIKKKATSFLHVERKQTLISQMSPNQ